MAACQASGLWGKHCDGSGGCDVGADRHLDITFGLQVVESSSLYPYFLEKRLAIPTSLFFHLSDSAVVHSLCRVWYAYQYKLTDKFSTNPTSGGSL